jgi:hypothetical protein
MTDDEKKRFEAIEEGVTREFSNVQALAARPNIPTGSNVQAAMRSVDRKADADLLMIEAFVDQAIHLRVTVARGSYQPGPRDAYVRRMVLEAISTISSSNGHQLDH